jgi:hypothetical protein
LLIQCHVADVIMKVVFSANMTGLATAVAGLCEGFEGLSVVDMPIEGKFNRRLTIDPQTNSHLHPLSRNPPSCS